MHAGNRYRLALVFPLLVLAFLILFSSRSRVARTATPGPTATPTPDKPSDDQDDVIKVSTDLVVVNVTVLDKAGKFVPR
jgi:hypothetical protein